MVWSHMLYMLCCRKSQPLAVFDLSLFYFLFSFWIFTQLIKLNLYTNLSGVVVSLSSVNFSWFLFTDEWWEIEGGAFCSSWFASEASFFWWSRVFSQFQTCCYLLSTETVSSLFFLQETCGDYDVQTNPFTHQKNAMPSLSLFYFPLPFSPFIIISLLKLLLLRKHYLSFFLSSDLDTAQGAVNLICFMMVVITFL